MRIKKFPLTLVFLLISVGFNIKVGECLFIIPSMLMSMAGGLLVGKMTMGGLLMMLMAANQQQQGQDFLRSIGLISHRAPSTGTSVPVSSPSNIQRTSFEQDVVDLIVRKRRKRDLGRTNEKRGPLVIDDHTQYRIMRQVAASDALNCLPQALCGISASPPSKQSGFLNDYTYLLKTVLTRDEDESEFDTDFDSLKTKNEDKDSATEKKKKKKNSEESSEEEEEDEEEDDLPIPEEEMVFRKQQDTLALEEMANEELLTKNPDFMEYAMKDSMKYYPRGPPQKPEASYMEPPPAPPVPGLPAVSESMSEADLDYMLARLEGTGGGSSPPSRPSGSFLSKLLPKLSLGFTGKGDPKFSDDPFFDGFKRRRTLEGTRTRPPTPEEEILFSELREDRRRREEYVREKRRELAEIEDPVEKFRIAAEFGMRVKSPRQCRLLFNACPWNYKEVLGMIADFRKTIMGQPLDTPKETVVDLKPVAAPTPSSGNNRNSVINLNTSPGSGVTSIIHQLPTGEKVEISLKTTKNGVQAINNKKPVVKPNSSNGNATNTKTVTASPSTNKTSSAEDLFDPDDKDNNDSLPTTSAEFISSSPIKNLDSLKATMLAIQKINNITVERKKAGKPVSYTAVLAELEGEAQKISESKDKDLTKLITDGEAVEELPKLPEPDLLLLYQMQVKNNKRRKAAVNAKRTAALLAAGIKEVNKEDDEADVDLPSALLGLTSTKGDKSPATTNKELATLLAILKKRKDKEAKKKKQGDKDSSPPPPEEDDEEEEEDDDPSDSDEGDDDHDGGRRDSPIQKLDDDRITISFPVDVVKRRGSSKGPSKKSSLKKSPKKNKGTKGKRKGRGLVPLSPIELHSLKSISLRKPKKLFLGHDPGAGRVVPL